MMRARETGRRTDCDGTRADPFQNRTSIYPFSPVFLPHISSVARGHTRTCARFCFAPPDGILLARQPPLLSLSTENSPKFLTDHRLLVHALRNNPLPMIQSPQAAGCAQTTLDSYTKSSKSTSLTPKIASHFGQIHVAAAIPRPAPSGVVSGSITGHTCSLQAGHIAMMRTLLAV